VTDSQSFFSPFQPACASQDILCASCLTVPRQRKPPSRDASCIPILSQNCTMNDFSRSPTRERGDNAKRNTSVPRLRRSVSAMKSLMPLKLSSRSLPELTSWPTSPTSPNREERFSREYGNFEIRDWLKKHHQQGNHPKHRDTPIYTPQGSPLIGRAYHADNTGLFPSSPPDSCSEGPEVANDPDIQDYVTCWNDGEAHRSSV